MALEDFERELAEKQEKGPDKERHRSRHGDEDRHSHRHRHHHRSSKHDKTRDEDRHHRKRSRDRRDSDRPDKHRSKRVRSGSPVREADAEDEWVEKEAMEAPPEEDILDKRDQNQHDSMPVRDSWMEAPSTMDVDYVQRSRVKKSPPSQFVGAKEGHERKMHEQEMERLARDLEEDGEEVEDANVKDKPAQHEVSYTFGDAGSQWRMSKLKNVYREARDKGKSADEVALNRYGDLRDFDDAREEERELDRRQTYGKDYVGLEKPSGEFFEERKLAAGIRRQKDQKQRDDEADLPQAQTMQEQTPTTTTVPLDQTALNRLKAKLMKAKLRKDPSAPSLEAEYNAALAAGPASSDTVLLSAMDSRLLSSRSNEVTAITTKRGVTRGQVVENTDMSIEDMVRQERRTRNTSSSNEGLLLANRIAKDSKFANDLEYMDDNATKLATRDAKSDSALRSSAIGDFQRAQRALDACPLCHHEERSGSDALPSAPVVSRGTRTYLTLPTEPELVPYGAVIVPVQHRTNLLECDDDEWEEMRNFMKALTRFYEGMDRGVVFYENAADRRGQKHAALIAVPLPWHLVDGAPGFFREALLEVGEEWSQHRKIIDTAKGARERFGKGAVRKMLVREMPYFHVWFTLDGGIGHVVEDEGRWPKGDLFAREVVGGMLKKGPEVVKKQGRWVRRDHRMEKFRQRWDAYDWTKVLMEAQ